MTRFARARGSKGSNEKVPEEATSWKEMKRQLQESQMAQENPYTPARTSVQQLLQGDATSSKTEWAVFEVKKQKPAKVNAAKIKAKSSSSSFGGSDKELQQKEVLSKTLVGKVKKSKTLKLKRRKISQMLVNGENRIEASKNSEFREDLIDLKAQGTQAQNVYTKQTKPKNKKFQISLNEKSTNVASKRKGNQKHDNGENRTNTINKQKKKNKLSKNEKIESGKPYKRRKPLQRNIVMTVNGREISLSYFDGFLVKTEDAERLEDLQKKLKEKGIPSAETKEAMKLERRKAEKALARERKKVCFHCRESGHMLSECPALSTAESTGICYKCGSTEHKISDCRVSKINRYRFAKCFVCSEQGHISSQCPNNPRGLYPKGGACHVCGDVTHLKRDCPKLEQQQESLSFSVGTMNGVPLETLDDETKYRLDNNSKETKRTKHIHF